jgi:ParB family chromosome partitioning protein
MSAQNKHGLGRGLEALFGDDEMPRTVDGDLNLPHTGVQQMAVTDIKAGRFQPRRIFNPDAIRALSESIKEKGVLEPILVRQSANGYEIIAGERRFRAAKEAGLNTVPVIVKTMTDNEALEVALIENIVRQDLSPIEEAFGLDRLMRQFSYTQEKIAQLIGKSRSAVANTLRLLALPAEVKKMVNAGVLSAGHARVLVGLENATELATEIVKRGMSVRQTEEWIAKQKKTTEKQNNVREKPEKDQDLKKIETDITQKFGLKVQINAGQKGKGKVILIYNDLTELEKIIDRLEQ